MALRKLLNQRIDNYYVSISFLTRYQIEKFTIYCTDNYQNKNYSFNINYKNKNNSNVFPFLFLLTKQEKKKNEIALRNGKKHTITFSGERFKKTCGEMIKINTQMNMIINIEKKKLKNTKKLGKIKDKKKEINKVEERLNEINDLISFLENEISVIRDYNEDDLTAEEIEESIRPTQNIIRGFNQEKNKLLKKLTKLQTEPLENIPYVHNFVPAPPIIKKTNKDKTIKESFINEKFLNLYNVKKK